MAAHISETLNPVNLDYRLTTAGYAAVVRTDRHATGDKVSAVVRKMPFNEKDPNILIPMGDIYFQDNKRQGDIQSATKIAFDRIRDYCKRAKTNEQADAESFRFRQSNSGKPMILILYPPNTDLLEEFDEMFWRQA